MINEKKKAQELDDAEEKLLTRRINKISKQLSDIHDKYSDVQELWMEKHKDMIESVLENAQGKEPEIIIQELQQKKVPQELISCLKHRDPRMKSDDDKRFWQFWKK